MEKKHKLLLVLGKQFVGIISFHIIQTQYFFNAAMGYKKSDTLMFYYPHKDEDAGEDQTWVCTKTRTGHVSIEDEKKYSARIDLRVSTRDKKLDIGGTTFKLRLEIKSLVDDERVKSVAWNADTKEWEVTPVDQEDDDTLRSLLMSVERFLHACLVCHTKAATKHRSKAQRAVHAKKAALVERADKVRQLNEANAAERPARFQVLQAWREQYGKYFVEDGFFRSPGLWYNAKTQDDKTRCSRCDYDMLNYYGSDACPFRSDQAPTRGFLEECHYCGHHFFNNWN